MMIRVFNILATGLLVAALAAGCSPGEPISEQQRDAGGEDDEFAQERYGALAVEAPADRAGEAADLDIQAQFLDARGVDVRSALQALEVWAPVRDLETGECRLEGEPGGAAADDHQPVSLHLLDVGDLQIEGAGDAARLEPRQLPDLLSSFYGVIYGSDWDDSAVETDLEYRPGQQYRFRAPGGEQTGDFDVAVQAPRPVVLAAANGRELYERDGVTVQRGQDLELVWETDGTEDGEVFIDVAVGSTPYGTRVQCRTDDDGAFSIPADSLARFDSSTELELRRVHRTRADVEGLEEVDVYFSTTDHIELHLE